MSIFYHTSARTLSTTALTRVYSTIIGLPSRVYILPYFCPHVCIFYHTSAPTRYTPPYYCPHTCIFYHKASALTCVCSTIRLPSHAHMCIFCHTCGLTCVYSATILPSHVWNISFICSTRLTHVRDMTHDSFICLAYPILPDICHSRAWHDLIIRVCWNRL